MDLNNTTAHKVWWTYCAFISTHVDIYSYETHAQYVRTCWLVISTSYPAKHMDQCMYSSHACTASTVPGRLSIWICLMGSPENHQNRLDGNRKLNELIHRRPARCIPAASVLVRIRSIARRQATSWWVVAIFSEEERGVSLTRSGVQRCPLYAWVWVHASSEPAGLQYPHRHTHMLSMATFRLQIFSTRRIVSFSFYLANIIQSWTN
jgi:hypothetical protein